MDYNFCKISIRISQIFLKLSLQTPLKTPLKIDLKTTPPINHKHAFYHALIFLNLNRRQFLHKTFITIFLDFSGEKQGWRKNLEHFDV